VRHYTSVQLMPNGSVTVPADTEGHQVVAAFNITARDAENMVIDLTLGAITGEGNMSLEIQDSFDGVVWDSRNSTAFTHSATPGSFMTLIQDLATEGMILRPRVRVVGSTNAGVSFVVTSAVRSYRG
jgi:hypothetical protein